MEAISLLPHASGLAAMLDGPLAALVIQSILVALGAGLIAALWYASWSWMRSGTPRRYR